MAEATTEPTSSSPSPAGTEGRIGPAAWWGLIGLTALGALARFYRLDAQSIWMDETFVVNAARLARLEGPLAVSRLDHSAPLGYWLAWLSTGLGGDSPSWLRVPTAVAGTLTVPMMFALGIRLFRSPPIALASAGVMAVSPFAVWYAQDARMYAHWILASAAFVYVCWPAAAGRPSFWGWAAMALTTAVGLYVHHYMALLSATFGLFLLAVLGPRDRRPWIWAATQLVAALAFVPWLLLTADRIGQAGSSKPMALLWMPYTYFTFSAGFSLGPSVRELQLDGPSAALRSHVAEIAMVGLATAAAGLAGLRRLLREGDRRAGAWCLAWAVGPVALAILATQVKDNLSYNARYAAACYPAAALILGGAIASARRSALAAVGVAGLALVSSWSLWNWYESPRYAKEDLRSAASFLDGAFEEGDLMVIANGRSIPTLDYYGFPCPPGAVVADQPGEVPKAAEDLDRLAGGPPRRAWLLEYREWEVDPSRSLRSALGASANRLDERRWPGVTLGLYRLPGPGGPAGP
ncbi:glycosyltransferase family 39 protein [Tautonia plasticadhaerens]|uniref:Glycosyltransferase RgtA/B/C/D-like domain-containing protein n=1 Tax=Tautonia plasticadhaerens TaxID=2527974 RepID=A0A518HFM4_9BACT|nr:glycosyltransferase family 39 protein [Tautonia plasticadhaerens]QDV39644.1 hypothetical protein ElP_76160 [Tautonia plasticadhaerens]